MNLDREPQEMARAGSEEIRALNHRTIREGAYTYPGQMAMTTEGLRDLASRLPQALQQMCDGLSALEAAGKIRTENDSAPEPHAADARSSLRRAEAAAGLLEAALRDAHSVLFSMGMPWEDDETGSVPA